MPMQVHGLDSRKRTFTKKVRAVNMLAAGNKVLFQPARNTRYLLRALYIENRGLTGTNTDAPNVSVDNGVDSGTVVLVAAVDLATTDATVKIATITNPTTVIDYDHPLRLKINDAADGSTAFPVNVEFELFMLSN